MQPLTHLAQTSTSDIPLKIAYGVLQRIDLIDREVTIRQENRSTTYCVTPNCEVLLNGERVKLRLLQPQDHVRIAYRSGAEGLTALSVETLARTDRSRDRCSKGLGV